jgi:hypothetical protein
MNFSTLLNLLVTAILFGASASSHAQSNFTKITTGPVPSDAANSYAAAWVDIDGDGDLDLFITNPDGLNLLYRNDGGGEFTKITTGPIVNAGPNCYSASWVDMNNDGLLDLYIANGDGSLLFLQQADGSFTQQTYPMATISGTSWGDYDEDGFVDLLSADNVAGMLWHNNGLGGLTVVPDRPIDVPNVGVTTWADYNGDGHLDAFVLAGLAKGGSNTVLYRNDGRGAFTPITNSAFSQLNVSFRGAAWGDYDNDGFLDVFLVHYVPGQAVSSLLFHNNANGAFTQVDESPLTTDTGEAAQASWGDYDNDGWLDLFISDVGGGPNRLYHNNGDGTFSRVLSGPIVADGGSSGAGIWGDYDRDGFLDLFVGNFASGGSPAHNYLYHNDGNSNAWIEVKCVGTRSNRSAIGAKVRVKATIGGKTFWQLREINTGNGWLQNAMEAHFGLGNATNVETLRIEWPSGTVQEFQNVAARQFLTVTEPSRLVPSGAAYPPQFILEGARNMRYDIQSSTNLADWSLLSTVTITNLDGRALITDTNLPSSDHHFYRAVLR